MDADFWHQKWKDNVINFHEGVPNDLLKACFHTLNLPDQSRVFVPLCGKTVDMHWLRSQGHHVIGAELSEKAVSDFFKEAGLDPVITPEGPLTRYSSPGFDLFVGDVFDVTTNLIGSIDAVYDRAASIALPRDMRTKYIAHLTDLTDKAPILLIILDYDQTLMSGPPFSIPDADIQALYGVSYSCTPLADRVVGLKHITPTEKAWLLS